MRAWPSGAAMTSTWETYTDKELRLSTLHYVQQSLEDMAGQEKQKQLRLQMLRLDCMAPKSRKYSSQHIEVGGHVSKPVGKRRFCCDFVDLLASVVLLSSEESPDRVAYIY